LTYYNLGCIIDCDNNVNESKESNNFYKDISLFSEILDEETTILERLIETAETGAHITWTGFGIHPYIYTIKINDQIISSNNWNSGVSITIEISFDELIEGIYIIEAIFKQTNGIEKIGTATIIIGDNILGDVNDDGRVDILDSLMIAQYYVGLYFVDGYHKERADVNGDGLVNMVDSLLIVQYHVGLITSFPALKDSIIF